MNHIFKPSELTGFCCYYVCFSVQLKLCYFILLSTIYFFKQSVVSFENVNAQNNLHINLFPCAKQLKKIYNLDFLLFKIMYPMWTLLYNFNLLKRSFSTFYKVCLYDEKYLNKISFQWKPKYHVGVL